ncbi:MAG TPA: hypothetical protein VEC10_09270 [Steroidobacteraceae bacterium]|nr:hypothetical protein [Steroidobacteraceae bacterium]
MVLSDGRIGLPSPASAAAEHSKPETAVNTQPSLRFAMDAFIFYFSVLVLWREVTRNLTAVSGALSAARFYVARDV